ncbi:MAG: aminomethyl-transferring glycine dehydrogenase subunit GcvPA, partial [Deltaproteobacteria bacterium]
MRYIPHTDRDIEAMLEAIGVERIEDLFDQIPRQLLEREPLDLPPAMSEPELLRHLRALAAGIEEGVAFLGAGAYPHHIPSAIPALVGRSEFYTAYTPYQPEISQGTLQAIFEFQTMICQLTGMEVANASLYDGASSVAEGCLMAQRVTRRKRILLSQGLHPEYRQVVRTYTGRSGMTIEEIPLTPEGRTDLDALATALHRGDGGDVACVVIQNPNFFGIVETIEPAAQSAHEAGALMIATFTEALSLALLEAPGKGGADIVAGEGQSFGIPLSFGGPYLGLFAAREAFVRKMPGRIVGQTVDHANQRRGFVLTLATREQHIRRERATSNICTNQGLCA